VAALLDSGADAVVDHCAILRGRVLDVVVIGTMRLAAALADPAVAVRTVVMASSVAAYDASSHAPVLRRESEELRPDAETTAARVLEAESYVRRFAEAHPHINVSILRLADLAGTSPGGPLAELLDADRVPVLAGFDPMIQMLHVDDAAAALAHAATGALAGTFNVAAAPMRWRNAVQVAQRPVREIPDVGPWTVPFARLLGMAATSDDTVDVLRFGRCVDTALLAGTGFHPRRTSADCARSGAGPACAPRTRPRRGSRAVQD
jgi:UDP-glucose 4-epimerase